MCSIESVLCYTLYICTLSQSCSKEKQATSNFPFNSKAEPSSFFESSCLSVTDCLFEAKLHTWNQLEGAGMCCMDLELICRAGMAILRETDRSGGKWVSVVSQLVMVSGGLHHFWLLNGCHNTIYSPSHPAPSHRVAFGLLRLFNKVFGLHKNKKIP